MVQRSELAQLNPQFLSKGLLKRVSIAERRNRKRSNKAESKNLTRGNRSEQTKQHTTTNENEKRVFVFRLGFFKLKIKMKNTRYLHLTNDWKRNEQKKKKISFCFTFFANGPELRPQENGFL